MTSITEPKTSGEGEGEAAGGGREGRTLSAAQAARAERQRLRARELRAARLAARPGPTPSVTLAGERAVLCGAGGERLLDTGGGFLLPAEAVPAAAPRPAPPPAAPPPLRGEWPRCEECGERFPTSWLLETFSYGACDACRDPAPADDGPHALVPRTQAKREYLLQDCDLDLRPPPLRSLRRRNPHRKGGISSDMRLYLRVQLQRRAELVWGSPERLELRRRERDERRERQASKKYVKELRALRMEARGASGAGAGARGAGGAGARGAGDAGHRHEWGEEREVGEDTYSRKCLTCGHQQTYEKM